MLWLCLSPDCRCTTVCSLQDGRFYISNHLCSLFIIAQTAPCNNKISKHWKPSQLKSVVICYSNWNYDTLKALVHASPVYHQQYLPDRQGLPCKCLERNISKLTILGAYMLCTRLVWMSFPKWVLRIQLKVFEAIPGSWQFDCQICWRWRRLWQWQPSTSASSNLSWDTTPPGPWNLTHETDSLQNHEALSKPEEIRIVGALYCFQLHCNLFDASPPTPLEILQGWYPVQISLSAYAMGGWGDWVCVCMLLWGRVG